MSRILAIDYGEKRVGLAVTDPLQIIATPLIAIPSIDLETFLATYIVEEEVEQILLGYPVHKDGKPTELGKKIFKLKGKLSKKFPAIQFHLVDESYSTIKAKEIIFRSGAKKTKRKDKFLKDKISAVVILQEYLGHI